MEIESHSTYELNSAFSTVHSGDVAIALRRRITSADFPDEQDTLHFPTFQPKEIAETPSAQGFGYLSRSKSGLGLPRVPVSLRVEMQGTPGIPAKNFLLRRLAYR